MSQRPKDVGLSCFSSLVQLDILCICKQLNEQKNNTVGIKQHKQAETFCCWEETHSQCLKEPHLQSQVSLLQHFIGKGFILLKVLLQTSPEQGLCVLSCLDVTLQVNLANTFKSFFAPEGQS